MGSALTFTNHYFCRELAVNVDFMCVCEGGRPVVFTEQQSGPLQRSVHLQGPRIPYSH